MPVPVLSVPAAPNLRFDRAQNAAPYVTGRIANGGGSAWSIHTGMGPSESFQCTEVTDCSSVTESGSTFRPGAQNTYRQAGTGAVWYFNIQRSDSIGTNFRSVAYS